MEPPLTFPERHPCCFPKCVHPIVAIGQVIQRTQQQHGIGEVVALQHDRRHRTVGASGVALAGDRVGGLLRRDRNWQAIVTRKSIFTVPA